MGPRTRYLGNEVPQRKLCSGKISIPPVNHKLIGAGEIATLKSKILSSGLTVPELVRTAWGFSGFFSRH